METTSSEAVPAGPSDSPTDVPALAMNVPSDQHIKKAGRLAGFTSSSALHCTVSCNNPLGDAGTTVLTDGCGAQGVNPPHVEVSVAMASSASYRVNERFPAGVVSEVSVDCRTTEGSCQSLGSLSEKMGDNDNVSLCDLAAPPSTTMDTHFREETSCDRFSSTATPHPPLAISDHPPRKPVTPVGGTSVVGCETHIPASIEESVVVRDANRLIPPRAEVNSTTECRSHRGITDGCCLNVVFVTKRADGEMSADDDCGLEEAGANLAGDIYLGNFSGQRDTEKIPSSVDVLGPTVRPAWQHPRAVTAHSVRRCVLGSSSRVARCRPFGAPVKGDVDDKPDDSAVSLPNVAAKSPPKVERSDAEDLPVAGGHCAAMRLDPRCRQRVATIGDVCIVDSGVALLGTGSDSQGIVPEAACYDSCGDCAQMAGDRIDDVASKKMRIDGEVGHVGSADDSSVHTVATERYGSRKCRVTAIKSWRRTASDSEHALMSGTAVMCSRNSASADRSVCASDLEGVLSGGSAEFCGVTPVSGYSRLEPVGRCDDGIFSFDGNDENRAMHGSVNNGDRGTTSRVDDGRSITNDEVDCVVDGGSVMEDADCVVEGDVGSFGDTKNVPKCGVVESDGAESVVEQAGTGERATEDDVDRISGGSLNFMSCSVAHVIVDRECLTIGDIKCAGQVGGVMKCDGGGVDHASEGEGAVEVEVDADRDREVEAKHAVEQTVEGGRDAVAACSTHPTEDAILNPRLIGSGGSVADTNAQRLSDVLLPSISCLVMRGTPIDSVVFLTGTASDCRSTECLRALGGNVHDCPAEGKSGSSFSHSSARSEVGLVPTKNCHGKDGMAPNVDECGSSAFVSTGVDVPQENCTGERSNRPKNIIAFAEAIEHSFLERSDIGVTDDSEGTPLSVQSEQDFAMEEIGMFKGSSNLRRRPPPEGLRREPKKRLLRGRTSSNTALCERSKLQRIVAKLRREKSGIASHRCAALSVTRSPVSVGLDDEGTGSWHNGWNLKHARPPSVYGCPAPAVSTVGDGMRHTSLPVPENGSRLADGRSEGGVRPPSEPATSEDIAVWTVDASKCRLDMPMKKEASSRPAQVVLMSDHKLVNTGNCFLGDRRRHQKVPGASFLGKPDSGQSFTSSMLRTRTLRHSEAGISSCNVGDKRAMRSGRGRGRGRGMKSAGRIRASSLRLKSRLPIAQSNSSNKHFISCSICGQIFKYLVSLRKHEARHSVSEDPASKICHHILSSTRRLHRHTSRHKAGTDFCCYACGKMFLSLLRLVDHLSSHTPYNSRSVCGEPGDGDPGDGAPPGGTAGGGGGDAVKVGTRRKRGRPSTGSVGGAMRTVVGSGAPRVLSNLRSPHGARPTTLCESVPAERQPDAGRGVFCRLAVMREEDRPSAGRAELDVGPVWAQFDGSDCGLPGVGIADPDADSLPVGHCALGVRGAAIADGHSSRSMESDDRSLLPDIGHMDIPSPVEVRKSSRKRSASCHRCSCCSASAGNISGSGCAMSGTHTPGSFSCLSCGLESQGESAEEERSCLSTDIGDPNFMDSCEPGDLFSRSRQLCKFDDKIGLKSSECPDPCGRSSSCSQTPPSVAADEMPYFTAATPQSQSSTSRLMPDGFGSSAVRKRGHWKSKRSPDGGHILAQKFDPTVSAARDGLFTRVTKRDRRDRSPALPQMHACNICQRTFNTLSCLKLHIGRHLMEYVRSPRIDVEAVTQLCCPQPPSGSPAVEGRRGFVCHRCGYRGQSLADLAVHVRVHSRKSFQCSVCRVAFVKPDTLRRHMAAHQP